MRDLKPEEAWKKAKQVCFDLLAVRARTTEELRQALLRRGCDEEVGDALLVKLTESGLLDDVAFAEEWVRSRHSDRGLARQALIAELREKGVEGSVAVAAADQLDRDTEEQRAHELVRKRLRSMTGLDGRTATRRLLGLLARRGYPQGLSHSVVREELDRAGIESPLRDDSTGLV